MTEYNIFPQLAFDWILVVYFFFGGLSAGIFIFSVIANYWKTEFKPLAKTSTLLTPVFVAIGMLFLLFDLGNPLRAWRLFLTFRPRSAISWGVWFLSIFFVLSLIYALLLKRGEDNKAKIFGYAGLPFALLVSTYTGILLAQAPGKVLYHTSLLPWLFLTGGLISGIAVVILVSAGRQDSVLLLKLGRFVAWLVLLELAMVFSEIIVFLHGGTEEATVVKALLGGQFSLMFWVLEIIVGAAIPAFILFLSKVPKATQYIASVFLLVGIFTMRYIVVIGGQLI